MRRSGLPASLVKTSPAGRAHEFAVLPQELDHERRQRHKSAASPCLRIGLERHVRGAEDTAAQDLLRMLGEVQAVHRGWRRRMRQSQSAVQDSYNQLVAESRLIRHFETVYVPGLLQTADYARRVLTEMVELHNLDIADVDAAVTTRMQRQQLLYDTSKRFEFLLAEPVLRWLLCPPDVMRGQLDRLQTVVGAPNIRFGILPLGVPLATTPQNSFQLYDDVAIVETFVGETTYRDDEAATYTKPSNDSGTKPSPAKTPGDSSSAPPRASRANTTARGSLCRSAWLTDWMAV
ncbi:DUF5753 domain-containing protein [Micromonospora sp. RTP1Z1]|uniref:DUF5753 domain-containing protein n=1 Tax=Micromonospora sp. RTP1Z1 TaxID=2994043 RepID=UPI0029C7622F|nr:DUF5753 domain-containing protein [Micromonospora sp. RTP1Z1]